MRPQAHQQNGKSRRQQNNRFRNLAQMASQKSNPSVPASLSAPDPTRSSSCISPPQRLDVKSHSKSQNVDLLLAGCKAFNISYKVGRWVRYRDTCLDTRYIEGKTLLGSCGISVAVAYGACLSKELHVPERGAASRTTKKGRV